MKNKTPERFNRAMKALIQAFFNDKLSKGDCTKCAIGNMCGGSRDWQAIFYTGEDLFGNITQKIEPDNYIDAYIDKYGSMLYPKSVIDKTGYTWQELAKVEKAFELATIISHDRYKMITKSSIMQDQFNGLMAVVEVLCEIDNIDPIEYKQAFEYNEKFEQVNK